ncbi:hypothetical protein F0562_026884 [Nyssa sinensis]|uniref:Uncharacterized protein n=1 Tax=Nyssa sinensis TaxID=561372 RepID=A0A5J5B3X5_9ASTE|nr:hypothetical protein F0562_026884 [Nyssa sinensis]
MVVSRFRRSLSFPNHPNCTPKSKKPYHVRSASLPCRSHPLISQIKDKINELKTWSSKPGNRTSSWLCDALSRLRTVHESLDDILQLPQTHESLRQHSHLIEKLLEDFLRFVDVYGIFQTLILTLKQEHSAAQVAVRKKNDLKIALYVKALKKMAKEMSKLVSNVQSIGRCSAPGLVFISNEDIELAEIIGNVNEVTVSVSVALFTGISSSLPSRKSTWLRLRLSKKPKKLKIEQGIQEFQQVGVDSLWGLRKKEDEEVRMILKKMHYLEDCIVEGGT